MQAVLPFSAGGGFLSPDVRVDYDRPSIHPANPATLGHLLGRVHVAGRRPDLSGTWLSESIVLAHEVAAVASTHRSEVVRENADLARILAATHFAGKAFGGDLSESVPTFVRAVIDQYHSVCRMRVRRQFGLFEPPVEFHLEQLFEAGLARIRSRSGSPIDAKLLPGRLDRLISAFVSLFRVEVGRPVVRADAHNFVLSDDADVVFSVDLRPLRRDGRAIVLPSSSSVRPSSRGGGSAVTVSVLVDNPVHRDLYGRRGIPVGSSSTGSLSILGPAGSIRIEAATVLRPNGRRSFVRSLHQLGSPFVDLRAFLLPVDAVPFRPVYGAGTDRPILRTSSFSGVGRVIHRDDPQVSDNHRRICAGTDGGPIGWIRPGFPAIIHLSDWHVDGRTVRGALASSVDRPGGFVVLEAADLVRVMGYEPVVDPSESDLVGLVPYECLCRLLDWSEQTLSESMSPAMETRERRTAAR